MERLAFEYTTTVEFSSPVTDHEFVLRCLPATGDGQRVEARLVLEPETAFAEQRDGFGNRLAVGSIEDAHDRFAFRVEGEAYVERARRGVCAAHPLYRYESRMAKMSPDIARIMDESGVSPDEARTLPGARALSAAVHEALRYEPGATTVRTTAAEAAAQGAGVCQDFSHVLIAMLRANGVPARYVSGLTVGEGATHAWVQAHLDGRWVGFDPTRGADEDDTYICMAVGRDWSDCPVERGTFVGFADQTQTVFMRVEQG